MDPLVSSFIGLLMQLGWASFKMLDAAVSDDDNGGTTGGEDDRDRDASDRAAVLCNAAAGLEDDRNASACHLLRWNN